MLRQVPSSTYCPKPPNPERGLGHGIPECDFKKTTEGDPTESSGTRVPKGRNFVNQLCFSGSLIHMRAAVYHKGGALAVEENFPIPKRGEKELLVKVSKTK
eukprot:524825-Pelagomonas_calceolata.AAC.8